MGALPNLDEEGSYDGVEHEAAERLGHVLASKYALLEVVGSGGMAYVYRATNTVINRSVAIKLLRKEHAKNRDIVERFLREARTANLVRHPNVVDVIDVASDESGSPFIVQEFLEGENLLEYLERRGGSLSVAELIEILVPVLAAIAEAHELGVVHRDIKPANIFLSIRRGRRVPKILDFGISKVRGVEMTAVGMMIGTPQYMAPELLRSSKDADPRSDVWALGVVIFEALTGRVPFEGNSVRELLIAIASTVPVRVDVLEAGLPAGIAHVVARCLDRDPDARYQSAGDLAKALAAAAEEMRPRPKIAATSQTVAKEGAVKAVRTEASPWTRTLVVALSALLLVEALVLLGFALLR